MLVILAVLGMLWPLIAKAVTTDEQTYYPQVGDIHNIALESDGIVNMSSSTDSTGDFSHARIAAPRQVAVSVLPGTEEVRKKIEEAFPNDPIMYWVALNESGLDPSKSNPSGAKGLFEIVGITWRNYHCDGGPFNADDNIRCAQKIHAARGLKDWEESRNKGYDGGWGKHL